jgi:hypothetical protein
MKKPNSTSIETIEITDSGADLEAQVRERAYERYEVRLESRLLIHSVCRRCGASRVVSSNDCSLEEWESTHTCKDRAQSSGRPAS